MTDIVEQLRFMTPSLLKTEHTIYYSLLLTVYLARAEICYKNEEIECTLTPTG